MSELFFYVIGLGAAVMMPVIFTVTSGRASRPEPDLV